MTVSGFNILRPMSYQEASFPVIGQLAPGAGNIVAALQCEMDISEEQVRTALDALVDAHPIAACGFYDADEVGGDPDYRLVKQQNASINFDFISVEDDQLVSRLNSERTKLLHHHCPAIAPMTKVVVVKSSAGKQVGILLSVSHAIGDGQSALVLVNELLELLDKGTGATGNGNIPESLWSHMPNSIAGPMGSLKALASLPKLVGYQKQADAGFGFPFETYAPCEEHRSKLFDCSLDEDKTHQVMSWIKGNSASTHGVLSAALFFAWMDELKRDESLAKQALEKVKSFPIITTVNLRDRLDKEIDPNLVGCFSSGVASDIGLVKNALQPNQEVEANDYLKAASDVLNGVETGFKENQHWKILRLYQVLGMEGLKKMLKDSSDQPMSMPLTIANLGRVDFGSLKNIKVSDFAIQPAFHTMGSGINAVVFSLNGRLKLCLSCAYPVTRLTTLRRFGDSALEHLTRIASFNKA